MSLELIEDLGLEYAYPSSKTRDKFGLYRCSCGNLVKTQITKVKNGYKKSCGCETIKIVKEKSTTHGMSKTALYIRWGSIVQRCYTKNNKDYSKYGGRGIVMCDEWRNDFISFYNWAITNGYSKDLSIDRIDNDKGYSPDNCRWTTREVQNRNTRKLMTNNTSGYRGVTFNHNNKKWICRISVDKKRINLGYFEDALEAAKTYDKYVLEHNLEHTLNFEKENYDIR